MVRYTGVNHLAMATGDMDATIRFWRDLLGMRLIAALGKPGYRHYFFEISQQDTIAFFEWPGALPAPEKEHGRPVKGPFVFDHVSVGVADENSLWHIKDRLTAADIWVSEVIDHGFMHSIYSFDPNGIPIEFSHNVPGINIRKTPETLDASPTITALEGPEPRPGIWPEPVHTPKRQRKIYKGQGSEFFQGYKKK
ncbi:MAG: VOC family protein [Actinomycetota bacterium]|nr:VOC family protein [Actinomycetota bacterium]